MSAVIRLGYVHLRVTDLEEARNHYSNTLGMEVVHEEPSPSPHSWPRGDREPGKLYLKCWDEWWSHSSQHLRYSFPGSRSPCGQECGDGEGSSWTTSIPSVLE